MRLASILLIVLQLTVSIAFSAEKVDSKAKDSVQKVEKPKPLPTAIMTQGDFARELVTSLGWGGGLTSEPKDRDFLQILEGRRTFKFEAENIYNAKTDDVSLRKNEIFGPFSGEAWIGGISVPSKVSMKVFIPIAGDYQLSAATKGIGQIWKIAGKEFAAFSGNSLGMSKIADISLKSGELKFEMMLPPEGGLDYLIFTAPDYAPIEPLDGWRFSEKLTNLTVAYVAASLLGLEGKLPVDDSIKPLTVIVSEMSRLPDSVSLSDIMYYGKFSGKNWVSTTARTAEIEIPLTLPQSGTYDIKLRIMGKGFTGEIDANPIKLPASSSMDWVSLGLHRLSQGEHKFRVKVPPYSGIDALVVTPRKVSPETYMNLTGVTGDPQAVVTYAEMVKNIVLIRDRFTSRK